MVIFLHDEEYEQISRRPRLTTGALQIPPLRQDIIDVIAIQTTVAKKGVPRETTRGHNCVNKLFMPQEKP
jgi:hypothetical protein